MGIYVALLRGINVSGHHMMKMADLKDLLTGLGFQHLKTYLQSGNVVFESEIVIVSDIEKLISHAVYKGFGYDIKIKVLEKEVFKQSFINNPFVTNPEIDTKQLYYIHLMGQPDLKAFAELEADEKFPEKMKLVGEVIYVHYPIGYGRSKLHGGIFEKKLKVSATARNHNTMKHLSQMLEAIK